MAIWRMHPSKAPGQDGMTAGMLRKAWPVLGNSLTNLFEKCLQEAIFPQIWRVAKLVIIPKSGKKDMSDPKTFRPI